MDKEVTVLLPAHNEEKAIGTVIKGVKSLGPNYKILVINNVSTDKTAYEAGKRKVKVIYEKKKGKGFAVRNGLRRTRTPIAVMIDADATYPTDVIPHFCEYLNDYDVVKGDRHLMSAGAMTKTHRFGNWGLSWLASILYGVRVKDVCSGLWAMRMDKVKDFKLISPGFTLEADLFINAVRTGCRILELPIEYKARIGGSKAKLAFTDGIKIGWFLIRKRFGK